MKDPNSKSAQDIALIVGSQRLLRVIVLVLFTPAISQAESIVETFDGSGRFSDVDGNIQGFDIDGWEFRKIDPENRSLGGSFPLRAEGRDAPPGAEGEELVMSGIQLSGSYVQRAEFTDIEIRTGFGGTNNASVAFWHAFGDENLTYLPLLRLSSAIGIPPTLMTNINGNRVIHDIEIGEAIAFEIVFHDELSIMEIRYDDDVLDSQPSIELRTEDVLPVEAVRSVGFSAGAFNDAAASMNINNFWLRTLETGDLNYDFVFDAHDLDKLSGEIRNGEHDRRYDLNKDSIVDASDRDIWVHEIATTYYGDANLDGELNSADLVMVFDSAQYEDDIDGNSSWETGDWNLDGDFNTTDLVLAFQDGGYEKGPVANVPEPSLLVAQLLLLPFLRRVN